MVDSLLPQARLPISEDGQTFSLPWLRYFQGLSTGQIDPAVIAALEAEIAAAEAAAAAAKAIAEEALAIAEAAGDGITADYGVVFAALDEPYSHINVPANSIFMMGLDGESGEDGGPGPPGAAGVAGAVGPMGPQGPIGFGLDGEEGPEGFLIPSTAIGGSGTVTSVGLSLPGIFTVSGSPVTTTGTLTAVLANETANTVFAGDPSSTVGAAPTFVSVGTRAVFNSVTSASIAYPASPIAGDYALLFVESLTNGGVDITSPPTGWAMIIHQASGLVCSALCIKKLTGTESGSVTVNFTGGTGGNVGSGFISYWHGLPSSGTLYEGVSTTGYVNSTNMTGASITTTGANRTAVMFSSGSAASSTTTPSSGAPSGWTNDFLDTGTSPHSNLSSIDSIVQATAGTVGAPTRTVSPTMFYAVTVLALIPGPATPGAPTFRALVNADLPPAAISQKTVSAPTAPASTAAFAMQGLAGAITPTRGGSILITISGTVVAPTGTTVDNGISYQISYGTGAAPINAAALTGTQVGVIQTSTQAIAPTAAADVSVPFSISATVAGLTLATAYWIDLAAKSITTISQMGLANISISAIEV